MPHSIFCLAPTDTIASKIVNVLRTTGHRGSDVSVVHPHAISSQLTNDPEGPSIHSQAAVGAIAGASAGGVFGASLGWLMGLGALIIPGIGPVVVAGPVLAILSGAAIGASAGGVAGALIGHGIPEHDAYHYETKVRTGHTIIAVHSLSDDEAVEVGRLLTSAGAQSVCTYADVPPHVAAQ